MQVKICGVTEPHDAYQAAKAGADFIGVIFSPMSKRVVMIEQACEIKSAIDNTSAQLVGVFVNESSDEIDAICARTHISTIQLHGGRSGREIHQLSLKYSMFYAITKSNHDSFEKNLIPNDVILLFDNAKSETSKTFDWTSFIPPKKPWILAGGLTVNNVAQAIHLLNPFMVDVASGVEQRDSIRKDHNLVHQFIEKAKMRKI